MRVSIFNFFIAVILLGMNMAFAEDAKDSQTAQGSLGVVEFETSCSDLVTDDFNRGVALLHHMMYKQAEQVFTEISEKDPDCAMAYWGLAMTQLHPLWAPPSKEELAKGLFAAKTAQSKNPPTEREQAYVTAIIGFYDDFETKDHPARIEIWEEGQKEVMQSKLTKTRLISILMMKTRLHSMRSLIWRPLQKKTKLLHIKRSRVPYLKNFM